MLRKEAASIQTKSRSLIPDKMVEKDLSSPPLTKTPKSELTAEQPLTKKTGTYQKKKILHSKTKKKPQEHGRRGTFKT